MHDSLAHRFLRFSEGLLAIAVVLLLINTFVHPGPNLSQWLAFVSIGFAIAALFVYAVSVGVRLVR